MWQNPYGAPSCDKIPLKVNYLLFYCECRKSKRRINSSRCILKTKFLVIFSSSSSSSCSFNRVRPRYIQQFLIELTRNRTDAAVVTLCELLSPRFLLTITTPNRFNQLLTVHDTSRISHLVHCSDGSISVFLIDTISIFTNLKYRQYR